MDVVFIFQGYFLTKKMKASYEFVVHITGRSCEYLKDTWKYFQLQLRVIIREADSFLCA